MKKFTIAMITLGLLGGFGLNVVNAQRITVTVAGNATVGFSGDGGPGRAAQIKGPKDICTDAARNVYFIDDGNARVRKISAAKGIVTTIAGGGTSTADGVPATAALLEPNYMCIDASGNLYITTFNAIRRIDAATGIITTVAGSVTAGYGGDGGPATAALLSNPQGLCMDGSGNIYVADRFNNRVRMINAYTGIIATVVGTGSAGMSGDGSTATAAELNSPITLCMNSAGDLFVSDQEPTYPNYVSSVIRKVSASSGAINSIAGLHPGGSTYGVSALDCTLGTITGMCCDWLGNLYCNEMSCSCRFLDMINDTMYLVGGNFGIQGFSDNVNSPDANMSHPYGMCVDNIGNLYIADSANSRIRKLVQLTHAPTFAFGHGVTVDAASGASFPLDTLLAITDMDAGQTETWTVLSGPANGTLSGFPATVTSVGVNAIDVPASVSYTPSGTTLIIDSFRIEVCDGSLRDTITVFIPGARAITTYTGNTTLDGTGTGSGTLSVSTGGSTSTGGGGSTGGGSSTTTITNVASGAPSVSIYPNPASSVLNIDWNNWATGNLPVIITDVTGSLVYKTAIANSNQMGSMQIDISALSAGVYFVSINGSTVNKFLKQ